MESQERKFSQRVEGINAIIPEAVEWIKGLDVYL